MDNKDENKPLEEVVEKKKTNNYLIIIVVLSFLVLALGGYICYDKFLSDNDDKKSENVVEDKKDNVIGDEQSKDNNSETNDEQPDDNTSGTNDGIQANNGEFDFDKLSNDLHLAISNKNMKAFLSNCKDLPANPGEIPESDMTYTTLSDASIDTVISMLKSASSVDIDITFSWNVCSPKGVTYVISTNSNDKDTISSNHIFEISYADKEDILLVSYDKKGYAFHFASSEDINKFIETLK